MPRNIESIISWLSQKGYQGAALAADTLRRLMTEGYFQLEDPTDSAIEDEELDKVGIAAQFGISVYSASQSLIAIALKNVAGDNPLGRWLQSNEGNFSKVLEETQKLFKEKIESGELQTLPNTPEANSKDHLYKQDDQGEKALELKWNNQNGKDEAFEAKPRGAFTGILRVKRVDDSGKLMDAWDTVIFENGEPVSVLKGMEGKSRISNIDALLAKTLSKSKSRQSDGIVLTSPRTSPAPVVTAHAPEEGNRAKEIRKRKAWKEKYELELKSLESTSPPSGGRLLVKVMQANRDLKRKVLNQKIKILDLELKILESPTSSVTSLDTPSLTKEREQLDAFTKRLKELATAGLVSAVLERSKKSAAREARVGVEPTAAQERKIDVPKAAHRAPQNPVTSEVNRWRANVERLKAQKEELETERQRLEKEMADAKQKAKVSGEHAAVICRLNSLETNLRKAEIRLQGAELLKEETRALSDAAATRSEPTATSAAPHAPPQAGRP